MLKNSFSISSLFALILLLIGTSCEESCDPVDVDGLNSIYLQFDTSGEENSFNATELDSVYFIRYQESFLDSFSFPVDTVNLYDIGFYQEGYKVRLSKDYPQGIASGPPYYSTFKYKFFNRNDDWQVRLQFIEIQGGYLDDCNYEARLKQFVLNDDTLDRTGSTSFVPVFKD